MRQFRYALRSLLRNPTFTLLVLITLGIGIGGSTAIFSVVDTVLLRPLPYEDPERLVFIWNRLGSTGIDKSPVAGPDFVDYKEQTRLFEGFVGLFSMAVPLTEEAETPVPVTAAWTTHNFFSLLGVDLLLGEMFKEEDEEKMDLTDLKAPGLVMPTAPAIISYELWQQRFGGDPEILGRKIGVNGQTQVIIGVAPRGFRLLVPPGTSVPERIDLWTPIDFKLRASTRSTQWWYVYARLKPGTSLVDAQAEMDRIAAWQRENFEFHRDAEMEIRVIPMYDDVTGHVRSYMVWFLAAAALLLGLTFANVANLLLLRSWGRQREMSICAAMGGGPRRILAQVLAESTILAVVGSGLGLLLARWGIYLLLALQPENLPRVEEVSVDARVLAVAMGMALVAFLICGLVPAFQASRIHLAAVLSERRSTGSPTHHWLRKGLAVGEIVISLVLLIGSGLILRSFGELSRVDPGFEARNILTARVRLPSFKYNTRETRPPFFTELLRRAAAIPGVERVSAAQPIPLEDGRQFWWGPWSVEGMNHEEWEKNEAEYRAVWPYYFETMGMRLVKGRFLSPADNQPEARLVTVVDEVFAARAWPGEEPLGKRLMVWKWDALGYGLEQTWSEVVGLIAHVRDGDLTRDGIGTIYCPAQLYPSPRFTLTLKSAGPDARSLIEPLRRVVLEMDPGLPLSHVRLMQDYLDECLAPTRFALVLMGVFALISAVLAGVGLYGVISSGVEQRAREIGIRIAFGAARGSVLKMVLGQSLVLAASGLVLGLVAAFFLTRGLSSFLFGVTTSDPLTFAGVSLLQVVIALAASVVPAWRATRVNPVAVLNSQ